MNITALEMGMAIEEANSALAGSFVSKVIQTGAEEWTLEFKSGQRKLRLLISVSSRNGRIHLASGPGEAPAPLEGFARTIKKALLRKRLDSFRQMDGDRVAELFFGGAGGGMALAVEIMGTQGNLYLLDSERKVAAIALGRKSRNELGKPYAPPEKSHGKHSADHAALETSGADEFPVNAALEKRSAASAREEKLAALKSSLTAPLREEQKKLSKRKSKLEQELVSLKGFEGCKRLGDLIMANYGGIRKGDAKVDVADLFSEDQQTISIPLDPAKSPQKNAEAYYKKYRKFEKGAPRLEAELSNLNQRAEAIKEEMGKLEEVDDLSRLSDLLYAREGGDSGVQKKSGGGKKKPAQPSGPKRFITREGYPVLVGRNDRENDELTFRVANGRDLWLHARDYPGSHVLVRMPKGVEPSRNTVEAAAMVALKYSKAAKAGKGEVTYTFAKNVKKQKGAPPGKVLVSGAKSVMVRIDEDLIKAMKD